jgi:ElaB/YqjD/DUF883 family membrane-anchored ribosome-binding protein
LNIDRDVPTYRQNQSKELTMEISGKDFNDISSKGQAFADKAADKVQNGIRSAQQGANSAASSASNKVESMRSATGPAIDSASDTAQSIFRQAIDAVSDATRKAQDLAADTQDSVVTYTRQKPVKALLIAAAAGAVLVTLVRALSSSSRDS